MDSLVLPVTIVRARKWKKNLPTLAPTLDWFASYRLRLAIKEELRAVAAQLQDQLHQRQPRGHKNRQERFPPPRFLLDGKWGTRRCRMRSLRSVVGSGGGASSRGRNCSGRRRPTPSRAAGDCGTTCGLRKRDLIPSRAGRCAPSSGCSE